MEEDLGPGVVAAVGELLSQHTPVPTFSLRSLEDAGERDHMLGAGLWCFWWLEYVVLAT